MPIQQITRTLTIANGATTSSVLELPPTYSLVSLIMPAVITGATFTVNASGRGSGLLQVFTGGSISVAAEAYTINYAANRYIRLTPADFYGMQALQLVSNIAQAQAVTIIAVLGVLQ